LGSSWAGLAYRSKEIYELLVTAIPETFNVILLSPVLAQDNALLLIWEILVIMLKLEISHPENVIFDEILEDSKSSENYNCWPVRRQISATQAKTTFMKNYLIIAQIRKLC
jgi:hypothetical protein